jgi:hypothetical protein
LAGGESRSRFGGPPAYIGWKAKEQKEKQLRNASSDQAQHFIKQKYLQEYKVDSIDGKVYYINSKEKKLQREG